MNIILLYLVANIEYITEDKSLRNKKIVAKKGIYKM